MANAFISDCPKGSQVTLYYNTGVIASVPVWVEHIGMVEDLDMNETEELTELSGRRETRVVKEYNEGEIELAITGTQICDTEYEGWQYLNASRTGGIPQVFCCLTNKISVIGAYGWRGQFWNGDRTFRGPSSGDLVNAVNLQPAAPCSDPAETVHVVRIATPGDPAVFDPTVIPYP